MYDRHLDLMLVRFVIPSRKIGNYRQARVYLSLFTVVILLLSTTSLLMPATTIINISQEKATLTWSDDIKSNFKARWYFDRIPSQDRWNDPNFPFQKLIPFLKSLPSEGSSVSLTLTRDPPTMAPVNFSWGTLAPYDDWLELQLNDKPLSVEQGIILLITPKRVTYDQSSNDSMIPIDIFGASIVLNLIRTELESIVRNLATASGTNSLTNVTTFEEPRLRASWLLTSDLGILNTTILFDVSTGLLQEYHVTLRDVESNRLDQLILTRDASYGGLIVGFDANSWIVSVFLLSSFIILRTTSPWKRTEPR